MKKQSTHKGKADAVNEEIHKLMPTVRSAYLDGKLWREKITDGLVGRDTRCPHHGIDQELDMDLSISASQIAKALRFCFHPCQHCRLDAQMDHQSIMLKQSGVPDNLLHATFDNYTVKTNGEKLNLERAKEFAAVQMGFIVMTGNAGNGKSHLAVAALRVAGCRGRVLTQNSLIYELRKRYHDNHADNIVERCMKTRFLILDDVEESSGGRDEFPALSGVLTYRHDHKLPSVLTSNLKLADFKKAIGFRLEDRFRESLFDVLEFTGPSRRSEQRSRYFANQTTQKKS